MKYTKSSLVCCYWPSDGDITPCDISLLVTNWFERILPLFWCLFLFSFVYHLNVSDEPNISKLPSSKPSLVRFNEMYAFQKYLLWSRHVENHLKELFADFWQMSDKVFVLFSAVVWPEQQLSRVFFVSCVSFLLWNHQRSILRRKVRLFLLKRYTSEFFLTTGMTTCQWALLEGSPLLQVYFIWRSWCSLWLPWE